MRSLPRKIDARLTGWDTGIDFLETQGLEEQAPPRITRQK